MKRVGILIGLAAGAVALVMLLMSMSGDDYKQDRRAGGVEEARGAIGEGSGEPGDEADAGASKGKDGSVDNDPNRIPGPDVTVKGIVMYDGTPVAGAKVQLLRAWPADPKLARNWRDPRRSTDAPAPIAEVVADENGRFTLVGSRRSRIAVRAWGEKTSVGTAKLLIPAKGDPSEVTVRVGPAFEITGVVVNEEGKPVGGVKLTSSSSSWQNYPFLQHAETAADGRFGFARLGRGSHTLIVEKEGYPTLHRTFIVPQTPELRVELVVGGAVTGTVTTDVGTPVAGARILLSSSDPARNTSGRAEVLTDESGAFSISPVVPGAISSASIEHPDWGRRDSSTGGLRLPRDVIKAGQSLEWKIELATGVTVRGVVVDKDTQAAVPNAKLTFMRSASGTRQRTPVRRDVTDAEGRFEVPHLTEGTYAIAVQGDRHVRLVAQYVQPNQPLTTDFFSDGVNTPDPVRIEVGGSARVEGRVKAEAMENFASTWVQVPELQNAITARADATGFYVLENLPVGTPLRLKTWMPAAESEPFTVEAGETKVVNLDAEGAPHFIGTVLGANGDPVVGAYVKASMSNNARNEFRQILQNSGWGTARTDAEGKFAIRLQGRQIQHAQSQQWWIAAVSYEYPLQVTKNVTVPKDGTSASVQITLQSGGSISGTVEFEGRGPLANARVSVNPKAVNAAAQRTDTRFGRYVYTDLAGRFTVAGVGEGDWTVSTSHPDGKAASQVTAAGDTAVQLVIKPTLALSGIVVDEDDNPLARVRVSAIIPNGAKESRRSATTDTSGRFRIAQLDPGDYELEASPARNQQSYYGGGGQQTGGFKTTRTRAYPAGTESIVIAVEPGNKISGVVQNEQGKPVGGAAIMALPVTPQATTKSRRSPRQSPAKSTPTTYANGRGEFTLKGVGEGQYEIIVIASGYLISSAQASVGQTDVTVTVGEGATLEGILLAPDGEPMSGQWINLQTQDPEFKKKIARWTQRGNNAWNTIGGWQATAATTKPDGSFKATGLHPGKYKVSIYTQRGVVPNTELHTGAGKTTIRLTEGMSVSGRVLDESGNPVVVPNGQLYISANANGQWKSARADADGNFELNGLPPGAVKIQVWAGNVYHATSMDVQAGDTGVRVILKKREPPKPK